ncbi:MAG TPA: hypothetical protein VF721_10465 [Pyrinomonadaceae bacterium]|jgi:hypothetical protein
MCEKKNPEAEPPPSKSTVKDEPPEQTAQEIHVNYLDTPPAAPPGRKIHPRQILPLIPEEEEEVSDETPSPPVRID